MPKIVGAVFTYLEDFLRTIMNHRTVLDANGVETRSRTESQQSSSSMDQLLDTLASSYRRHVVRELAGDEEPLAFDRLVERAVETTDGIERNDARIALYHVHLPKLVDSGVVTFDRDAETVASGPQFPMVASSLEALEAAHENAC